MAVSFRESFKKWTPGFLLGFNGERLGYVANLVIDALTESIREGVKARMPGLGTPTALGHIGNDRVIDRGPTELDAAYAERLRTSMLAYRTCGSAGRLLMQVRHFFSPNFVAMRTVSDRATWHVIDPTSGVVTKTVVTPTNWQWDQNAFGIASPPRWRRVWLVIEPAGKWARDVWSAADPYDSVGTWGSTATYSEILALRRLCEQFRSDGVQIVNIILAFTAGILAPGNAPGSPMPAGDFDLPATRIAIDAAFVKGTPK